MGEKNIMKLCMIHEAFHSCEEDIAASLAASLNRPWALMYCHAWGFEYSNATGTIGGRLHEGVNDFLYNLNQYHGIEVKDQGVFLKDSINIFLSENPSEYPIVVYIDDLHCPWGLSGMPINRPHPVLVRGVCDGGWSCMDPYLLMEHAVLTFDCIPESGSKVCTIDVHDVHIEASTFESHIIASSYNISSKELEANALYKDMNELVSLDSEIVLYNGRIRSDLLDRLTYLSRRRRQYAKYIITLGEMLFTKFIWIAALFYDLADLWEMLYKKLMKSFCMSSWSNDKEVLLGLLSRIMHQEIYLAKQILAKGSLETV